ncbi:hypothetical protein H5T89_07550, partial [bacterium]|nr:hypothetical protein [bacterium]
ELDIIRNNWPKEVEVISNTELRDNPEKIKEIDIIVGGINRSLLEKARNLKLIHTLGHGIDFILKDGILEEIIRRKILVAKANPASINISEFVIMCMIALSRRTFLMHEALAFHGSWSQERKKDRMKGSLGGELFNSTLGLIGFGAIGQEVYKRAKVFGMHINVCVLHPERLSKEQYDLELICGVDEIDKVLSKSRYVVLSLPLTPKSYHLINEERFNAMQDGSYLINISRGGIIDEKALYYALKSGKLAGAALDVWEVEEKGIYNGYPTEYPLHNFNVIMTPHYSGATKESRERALINIGENLKRFLSNEQLLGLADLESGY